MCDTMVVLGEMIGHSRSRYATWHAFGPTFGAVRGVMERIDKVHVILLALVLIAVVAVTGPQSLGALMGAALFVGMMRVVRPRR